MYNYSNIIYRSFHLVINYLNKPHVSVTGHYLLRTIGIVILYNSKIVIKKVDVERFFAELSEHVFYLNRLYPTYIIGYKCHKKYMYTVINIHEETVAMKRKFSDCNTLR